MAASSTKKENRDKSTNNYITIRGRGTALKLKSGGGGGAKENPIGSPKSLLEIEFLVKFR